MFKASIHSLSGSQGYLNLMRYNQPDQSCFIVRLTSPAQSVYSAPDKAHRPVSEYDIVRTFPLTRFVGEIEVQHTLNESDLDPPAQ